MTSFTELIGKVDNLHDPVPAINTRPVMLAIVLTFLVSPWFFVRRCATTVTRLDF